jgi:hypothetical protein
MSRHTKAGRNDLCPCGSGKKSKRCCQAAATKNGWSSKVLLGLVLAAIAGAVVAGIMSFGDNPATGPAAGKVWSQEHGHYH